MYEKIARFLMENGLAINTANITRWYQEGGRFVPANILDVEIEVRHWLEKERKTNTEIAAMYQKWEAGFKEEAVPTEDELDAMAKRIVTELKEKGIDVNPITISTWYVENRIDITKQAEYPTLMAERIARLIDMDDPLPADLFKDENLDQIIKDLAPESDSVIAEYDVRTWLMEHRYVNEAGDFGFIRKLGDAIVARLQTVETPESDETEDDDDDETPTVPASEDTNHYEAVTHDDAACTEDSDEDEEVPEAPVPDVRPERLGDTETENLSVPVESDFVAKYKAFIDGDDDDDEDEDDEPEMSDEEFLKALTGGGIKEKPKSIEDNFEDAFDITPQVMAKILKRTAKNMEDVARMGKMLAKIIKRTDKIDPKSHTYRAMFTALGRIEMALAAMHMSNNTLLTSDHLSLYNAGVAEMQAQILTWQASEACESALNNDKEVR